MMKAKFAFLLVVLVFSVAQNSAYSWTASGKGKNPSGGYKDSWDMNSTHARLTEKSLSMLRNFEINSISTNLILSKFADVIAFSNAPDVDDTGLVGGVPTMMAHFNDPSTGKNWLGNSYPTAETEFIARIYDAFNFFGIEILLNRPSTGERKYKLNFYQSAKESYDAASYNLGKALHFLQDMSMPFHAKNIIAYSQFYPVDHMAYEQNVEQFDKNIFITDHYTKKLPKITGQFYADLLNVSSALNWLGYNKFYQVINMDVSRRDHASEILLKETTMAGADVLYVFSIYLQKIKLNSHLELLTSDTTICRKGYYLNTVTEFNLASYSKKIECAEIEFIPFTSNELEKINAHFGRI